MLHFAVIWLFCIVIFLPSNYVCENIRSITVATYNMWNIMFNWDVRKFHIAQMIREINADIIGLQELRADGYEDLTQLDELQELLPNYRWQHFAVAHKVPRLKDSYITGMDIEGVGILSRLPIVRHEVQNLSASHSSDGNDRVVLHAQVLLDEAYQRDQSQIINVAVVHFSYDRQQQCHNALEVLHFLKGRHLRNAIVMGDFNIYRDFESPVVLFTNQQSDSSASSCSKLLNLDKKSKDNLLTFTDVWTQANPKRNGFTFSNMPIPGLESRPDRILITAEDFVVQSAALLGNGTKYRSKYFHHVAWSRLERVLAASLDSYNGRRGRSCPHDCGPHASCRCGVCVAGGDRNTCHIPNCNECNTTTFFTLVILLFISVLLICQLLFGSLQLLLVMNNRAASHRSPNRTHYCQLCLCDPTLYSSVSARMNRIKRHRFSRIYPILRLPPMILVIVSMLMIFLLVEFVLYALGDSLHNVYNIIPEELNPSDHLLLYAKLEIKNA